MVRINLFIVFFFLFVIMVSTGCDDRSIKNDSEGYVIYFTVLPPLYDDGGLDSSTKCDAESDCQDAASSQNSESIYICNSDKACTFFKGFTGVPSPQTDQDSDTDAGTTDDPDAEDLPVDRCFNRSNLSQALGGLSDLTRNDSVTCQCGIESRSALEASYSSVNDVSNTHQSPDLGLFSLPNRLVCISKKVGPDIRTSNFVYPESTAVGGSFPITFDIKNVGERGCEQLVFHLESRRITDDKVEYLGGSGAIYLLDSPFKKGEKESVTLGRYDLPHFGIAADYELIINMFCAIPLELHMVNNIELISITAK